jgi:predicted metal-dependent phosphoesterase TrpH
MELGELARLCGLDGIAVADHDILPDVDLLRRIEAASRVRMLPAVELTTKWNGRTLHLLAYRFDPESPALREMTAAVLRGRRRRWDALVERLASQGVKLDRERLDRRRNQSSPGRRHLARELVAARRAPSLRAAFTRLLDPIAKGAPEFGVDLVEAIRAVHAAGGAAVLAHPPVGMTCDDWRALANMRLDGVETRFGSLTGWRRRFLADRAAEHGWIASAGSDYHGDGSRDRLGSHHVDRTTLDRLLGDDLSSASESRRPPFAPEVGNATIGESRGKSDYDSNTL